MGITLDSILNIVIPLGIFAFLFFLFYSKFKPTFDLMFQKFGEVFSKVFGGAKEKAQSVSYEVVYQ